MHYNSHFLFRKYALHLFRENMKVLEISPDRYPSTYQSIAESKLRVIWHSVELERKAHATYVSGNEYKYPVKPNSYDIVLSGQVIEHVRKPWIWIKELSRITKKGGYVVTIAPVSWTEHRIPVDCWRIYPDGMKTLYQEAKLTPIMIKCETLEIKKGYPYYQGNECSPRNPKNIIKKILHLRVECAVDTIGIGRKNR